LKRNWKEDDMARINQALRRLFTHEGAPAKRISVSAQLRRSVLSCLLWEDEFYEDGQEIGARILDLAAQVPVEELAALAVEARQVFHLRHAPLLLAVALARRGTENRALIGDTVAAVIGRVDELAELVALYWRHNPDRMLSRQVRRGLRTAFGKFDAYQFAKYDFDKGKAVKLRDVLRLARPKPRDDAQSALFKAIKEQSLEAPDTWEVAAMRGMLGKDGWTRLVAENRLGYLALLRNLRNMDKAAVDPALVEAAILARRGARNVWPFRYVAAARACPRFERALDRALIEALGDMPALSGRTIVLVDVSGSMQARMSARSDLTRMDAACTLAAIIPGELRVFSFSGRTVEVPARRGMAGVDAIRGSQPHGSTMLGDAVATVNRLPHDRLIVITDEQSHQAVPAPAARHAYMIDVASAKNGVGYGRWTHIDGFSEAVLRFVREAEPD
jgi:hypothetical protein